VAATFPVHEGTIPFIGYETWYRVTEDCAYPERIHQRAGGQGSESVYGVTVVPMCWLAPPESGNSCPAIAFGPTNGTDS
jgi:hypothetical protein